MTEEVCGAFLSRHLEASRQIKVNVLSTFCTLRQQLPTFILLLIQLLKVLPPVFIMGTNHSYPSLWGIVKIRNSKLVLCYFDDLIFPMKQ